MNNHNQEQITPDVTPVANGQQGVDIGNGTGVESPAGIPTSATVVEPSAVSNAKLPKKGKKQSDQVVEYEHNQIVHIDDHFYIKYVKNPGGSGAFRVEGDLPRAIRKPGEPPRARKQRETFDQAKTLLDTLELRFKGIEVKGELKQTTLQIAWLRKFEGAHDKLQAYGEGPELVDAVIKFYMDHHVPGAKGTTIRTLLKGAIAGKVSKRSKSTIGGWKAAVNSITRRYGTQTEEMNRQGRPLFDMPAEEITEARLLQVETELGYDEAKGIIRRLSAVLQYGVDTRVLQSNVAQKIKLEANRSTEPEAPPAILTIEQIQSGLNMAALLHGGKPLPIFVMRVFGAMRPISELPFFSWDRVLWHANAVKVWSSKTQSERIVELPPNAMAILRWCFEKGIQPECTASSWGAIRMAMGYWDCHCPSGLQPEGFEDYDPWTTDLPRHTGCSFRYRYDPDLPDCVRWANNSIDVFLDHYCNSTLTIGMVAPFYNLLPETMPRTPVLDEEIRLDLVKHKLLNEGAPLPAAPVVPQFIIRCPQPQKLPTIPDDKLERLVWETSATEVAETLGTNRSWLVGYMRVKQLRFPRQNLKRVSRPPLETVPKPPPFLTISDDVLKDMIWKKMSTVAAAKELGVYCYWLRVYCVVRGIKVPTRRTFAKERAARAHSHAFRPPEAEVRELLNQKDYRVIIQHYGIKQEQFVRYCQRRDIPIPGYVPKHYRQGQYGIQIKQPGLAKAA
jgi:hypothetical protein